jgi:N,N'-diacetyllegionaminate synthase
VEQALGDGIKRASASELENRPVARKSIVASRAIQAGELFSAENMTTKRPGSGISPMRWDEIIGRTAPRDFAADEFIEP